jgi:dolichol-phosphate mannosyltransferase
MMDASGAPVHTDRCGPTPSKRVLVTGATGFVGANLARRLLHDGHDLHVVLRSDRNTWRIADIRADVAVHQGSLDDGATIARIVAAARPEWVFHLAAHGAYSWERDVDSMVATNVAATFGFVRTCLDFGVECFVNTGSSSEYGLKDHPPEESEGIAPNSPYAVTKAAATLFCGYLARERGVPAPTLRLYSTYGPWEEPKRLVPALLVAAMAGRLPPLVDPNVARDFVYVDDVVDAYLRAASRPHADPGAVYNVGTGVQTTIAQLVAIVREMLPIEAAPDWGSMPNRAWDTTTWVADPRKIAADLEWRPRVDVRDGLARTLRWLQSDPSLLPTYRSLASSP